MKKYDVVVVGSGSGGEIVEAALNKGFSVAWVDRGPLGGTCLNTGCIPSKMLIYPADRVMEIREAQKLGIKAQITEIDFMGIMKHMRQPIQKSRSNMQQALKKPIKNLDYYPGMGHFVKDYTIEINGQLIRGKKFFIGSGVRPSIPQINGINNVEYLTNENVFDLQKKPESMIIIGGGYIAVEFAHFFSAMDVKTTMLLRSDRLIRTAEPEISELLMKKMKERITVKTNVDFTEVKQKNNKIMVAGKNKKTGATKEFVAEKLLVATGRKSNADLLKVENTGIKVDTQGFIKVNEFLKTTKKNIWAFGDAIGKYMFKHVANEEAIIAWQNAVSDHKHPMDYSAVPYAVFSYPQIASVGLTEIQAKELSYEILVGKAAYSDVAKGEAMVELEGFTKAIVDKKDGKILGFHIIGPYAPMLIQEVINAMALGGRIEFIGQGMHIHPALPELILRTFGNLREI